jgi:hypothetical protein
MSLNETIIYNLKNGDLMMTEITNNNQEIISATKEFLSLYLAKKNKTENEVYLSFYLSEDSKDFPTSRSIRFIQMLKEVELTLKSQLNPKLAKALIDQLQKLNPAEVVKSNKMSIAFFISETFAGFICSCSSKSSLEANTFLD